jgi:hypothetical protein
MRETYLSNFIPTNIQNMNLPQRSVFSYLWIMKMNDLSLEKILRAWSSSIDRISFVFTKRISLNERRGINNAVVVILTHRNHESPDDRQKCSGNKKPLIVRNSWMNPDVMSLKSTKSVCIPNLLIDCAGMEILLFRMMTTFAPIADRSFRMLEVETNNIKLKFPRAATHTPLSISHEYNCISDLNQRYSLNHPRMTSNTTTPSIKL